MATVSDAARRNAELVELMDLHALVAGVRGFEQAQRGVDASLAIKSDSGMQTELHPVEANIDKQYEWNEWELRRKALKLVCYGNATSVKTLSRLHLKLSRVYPTIQLFFCRFVSQNQANLRSKKTHSTQTHESNYRRANETQVYVPKYVKAEDRYQPPGSFFLYCVPCL
jgi:hypothetical protein